MRTKRTRNKKKFPITSPFPSDGPTLRPSVYLRIIRATVSQHRDYSFKLSARYPAYDASESAFRCQLEGLPDMQVIIRSYAGNSSQQSGWSRDEDDRQESKGSSTRQQAYISVNSLQSVVEHYEFVLIGDDWLPLRFLNTNDASALSKKSNSWSYI